MINFQNYAIPAGVSGLIATTGGKYFDLLGASGPMNVVIFDKGQNAIVNLQGVISGVHLGPYEYGFRYFQITTQSGNAGTAMIAVGDEPMTFNINGGLTGLGGASPLAGGSVLLPAMQTDLNSDAHLNYAGYGYKLGVAAPSNALHYGGAFLTLRTSTPGIVKLSRVRVGSVNAATVAVNVYANVTDSVAAGNSGGPVGPGTQPASLATGGVWLTTAPASGNIVSAQSLTTGTVLELIKPDSPLYITYNAGSQLTVVAQTSAVSQTLNVDFEWSELPNDWAG